MVDWGTVVTRNGLAAADDGHLQFSGSFDDPILLLETCQKMSFEGIASKRKDSAY